MLVIPMYKVVQPFIGENVHPVVVVAHAFQNNQRCFATLNMTVICEIKIELIR